MISPYESKYYECTPFYERFGNFIVYPGTVFYRYITDREVPGVEPFRYSISNRMNVFDYKKQEFVRISDKTLYPTVNLYNVKKGAVVTSLLHRLYMLVFCYIPGCENFEVNHIDGNKYNCTPSNLEWVTHEENMNHAFKYVLSDNLKMTDDDIIELIDMYNNNEKIKDIANRFGISKRYVMDIVKGRKSDHRSDIRLNRIRQEHPITRKHSLTRLPKELTIKICEFLDKYQYIEDKSLLYTLCLEDVGLENTTFNRNVVKNIFIGKTYTDISSKYSFNKSSTTIERVAE